MRNWNAKKIILQIVLPVLLALGLILGLSIGLTRGQRKMHEGEKNNITLALRYTHAFAEKTPMPIDGKYDDSKYLKYWDGADNKEELLPYDADYTQIYATTKMITMGDLVDDLNNVNNKMLFNMTPYVGMGRLINSYKRPDGTYTLNKWPHGYIMLSSPTNPKRTPGYEKSSSANSLSDLLSVGIDATYIQNNDTFYINFWHD